MAQKQNGGRQEKPIDWKRVDELLQAGCPGTEIAPHFDLTSERFYERVAEKYGMSFTDYSCRLRQKGDSSLREMQYKKALKGDNMMLIWLGKNRLNQSDSPTEVTINPQTMKNFNAIMNQISNAQSRKSDLKMEDSNIINEQKS